MKEVASRIAAFDIGLFTIETQTTAPDRIALLRVQSLVRAKRGRYSYIEIGSHLGGSLLPHLLDPLCDAVHSVDPRPQMQNDARGRFFQYDGNSTKRMRRALASAVPSAALARLTTWDYDSAKIPAQAYGRSFDLALIDGEHTNVAAFSDFVSILPALSRDACIVFHDANLVLDAIANIERLLRHERTLHATVILRDCVAVIGLRGAAAPIQVELGRHAVDRESYETWARSDLKRQTAANIERDALARPDPSPSDVPEGQPDDTARE